MTIDIESPITNTAAAGQMQVVQLIQLPNGQTAAAPVQQGHPGQQQVYYTTAAEGNQCMQSAHGQRRPLPHTRHPPIPHSGCAHPAVPGAGPPGRPAAGGRRCRPADGAPDGPAVRRCRRRAAAAGGFGRRRRVAAAAHEQQRPAVSRTLVPHFPSPAPPPHCDSMFASELKRLVV